MLKSLAALCGCAALLTGADANTIVRSGTTLEVRLTTSMGTRRSHRGDRVNAMVIAPVRAGREALLLQGAVVSGTVEAVQPLGLGLKRASASLAVGFDSLQLRDGTEVPIKARVHEIETAREHVDANGAVIGIDPAANLSCGLSFLMSTVLVHSELEAPAFVVKFLAARSPDSEIYLPRGTELVLELTEDLTLNESAASHGPIASLSSDELESARQILSELPAQHAELKSHHSSDLLNVMLVGTPSEVGRAFRSAGWTGENKHSPLALYRMFHCMVQRMGYSMAPMSRLTFNGKYPTKVYQKSLDSLAKRHHVRFWRQGNSDVWLGAASEDVAFRVRRMHVTHATDGAIDNERAKVVNDLWFTGCVSAAALVQRDGLATGTATITDGDIAVLRLGACDQDEAFPAGSGMTAGGRLKQALIAVSDDAIRANPLTVGFVLARSFGRLKRQRTPEGSLDAGRGERLSVIETHGDELACSGCSEGARVRSRGTGPHGN